MADKSAQYPKSTWNDCIEFVKTVSSFNLKAVSYGEVAKKYGLTNPAAKSFTSKVSTCKQFGLITTSGGNTIQLTDTCKRILFPTGEDISATIRACFGMPTLYTKLIAAYDGKAVPNKDILSNILMNDHQIQKSVKDTAAQVFIESAEQLGLIRGGILCYSDAESVSEDAVRKQPATDDGDVAARGTALPASPVAAQAAQIPAPGEADYITQAIPFGSGKIARFSIPVDATEDDLMLLHDMFDVLLKRKFKLDI